MNGQIVNDVLSITNTGAHADVEGAAAYTLGQRQPPSGTQQQIKLLAASNSFLRRNLIRFSHRLKQLRRLAYYDELTGLPNPSLLLDRLHQALQQAARQRKQVLLIFIDLDRFKLVNEKLGYVMGDRVLQQVAVRLAAHIRGADTACRYGGDEFVVMLPEMEGQEGAAAAVHKIRAQFAAPYVIDGQAITLTASMGVAIYRGDKQSPENLIRQAELDMFHAKSNSTAPAISLR